MKYVKLFEYFVDLHTSAHTHEIHLVKDDIEFSIVADNDGKIEKLYTYADYHLDFTEGWERDEIFLYCQEDQDMFRTIINKLYHENYVLEDETPEKIEYFKKILKYNDVL